MPTGNLINLRRDQVIIKGKNTYTAVVIKILNNLVRIQGRRGAWGKKSRKAQRWRAGTENSAGLKRAEKSPRRTKNSGKNKFRRERKGKNKEKKRKTRNKREKLRKKG